jgi:hypothetical protein
LTRKSSLSLKIIHKNFHKSTMNINFVHPYLRYYYTCRRIMCMHPILGFFGRHVTSTTSLVHMLSRSSHIYRLIAQTYSNSRRVSFHALTK